MPYLTDIEKKWISYQLLHALRQLHEKLYFHCDIKPENVLISSTGNVFLSDISPYKPAYIQQDDVGSFTYFFNSTKSCYLAPERLVSKNV
jgi:phosphoinositide-3-kinase regulatory subunit 4